MTGLGLITPDEQGMFTFGAVHRQRASYLDTTLSGHEWNPPDYAHHLTRRARRWRARSSSGWRDVIDLGDITSARGAEGYVALWLRLWGAPQVPMFNIKVVR
jgi:hypothetical protein